MNRIDILLVSRDESSLAEMLSVLAEQRSFHVSMLSSSQQAWAHFQNNHVDVAVVSEELEDCSGLVFVKELVSRNPFINCALASSLTENEFHEATEGYGVFMQLPPIPTTQSAHEMIGHLNKIHQLIQ